jgi:hypothetical protein
MQEAGITQDIVMMQTAAIIQKAVVMQEAATMQKVDICRMGHVKEVALTQEVA